MARYYEGLLGIPSDVPAPDYYQLLGVAPDAVDEESVKRALLARLDRLDASPGAGSSLAQHLRRELQRARATLLDPRRREEYVEEARQQRLSDVKEYVAKLVEEGVLGSTKERALLARMERLGLSASDAQASIDEALGELQATRREEPRDEARRRAADEQVLAAMHAATDARLIATVGVPGTLAPPEDAPVAPRAAAAPEPAPAPEPDSESEAAPPPLPAGPIAESIWQDSSQIGVRTKSASNRAREEEEAMRDESERRAARRSSRTWLGLFSIASAFVLANGLALLLPDVAARVESATAGLRSELLHSPLAVRYAAGSAATAAALLGLLVFLAGRQGRRAFLVPTVLLMVPAAYVGLLPGGQKRLVLRERDALAVKTQAVVAERDSAIGQIDSARQVADERAERIAELARKHEEESAELSKKLETATVLQQTLAKKLEEESLRARKAAEQEPVLAERAAKIAELQKSLKAQEAAAQKLRVENEELKKKVAAATAPTAPSPQPQASASRAK